jgi:hypothetical protein
MICFLPQINADTPRIKADTLSLTGYGIDRHIRSTPRAFSAGVWTVLAVYHSAGHEHIIIFFFISVYLRTSMLNRRLFSEQGVIEIIYNPFYLYLWCSKVNEQTHHQSSGLKIMDTLRFMDVFNIFYSFQFNKNASFYQQICKIFSDHYFVIIYWYCPLLLNLKTFLSQFVSKCVLIDLFKKSLPRVLATV